MIGLLIDIMEDLLEPNQADLVITVGFTEELLFAMRLKMGLVEGGESYDFVGDKWVLESEGWDGDGPEISRRHSGISVCGEV